MSYLMQYKCHVKIATLHCLGNNNKKKKSPNMFHMDAVIFF